MMTIPKIYRLVIPLWLVTASVNSQPPVSRGGDNVEAFGAEPISAAKPADQVSAEMESETLMVAETASGGWKIMVGDELFCDYVPDSVGRPVIYPIIGPDGLPMTRSFPFEQTGPYEKSDHDHHRSFWFTHGEVNGVDFWIDDPGTGQIVQTAGTAAANQDGSVVIRTDNDWKDTDGELICRDKRRFQFFALGKRRIIDLDVQLIAPEEAGEVHFGDTKEGTFGLRVPGTMKVDAEMGGKIINDAGDTDADTWGKVAAWVDYSGPLMGENSSLVPAGIRIHNHPSSFGYPCRWQVRTYGLFAANPFGVHHFTGEPKTDGYRLQPGESIRISYRVIFYSGPFDNEVAERDAAEFGTLQRPELSALPTSVGTE